MSYSSVLNPCAVCGKTTSMWCSRCQSQWYCSADHLQNDWQHHRHDCVPAAAGNHGLIQNSIATPPPAEPQYSMVSAIMFAPDEERPRIVTVNCRPTQKAMHGSCPVPMVDILFPDGRPQSIVLTQGLNGEPLRFPLHLFYSPMALAKGTPVNRAIYHITSGAAPKAWCGCCIVLKFNGCRKLNYSDAGSNDLPALSAYFLAYT